MGVISISDAQGDLKVGETAKEKKKKERRKGDGKKLCLSYYQAFYVVRAASIEKESFLQCSAVYSALFMLPI